MSLRFEEACGSLDGLDVHVSIDKLDILPFSNSPDIFAERMLCFLQLYVRE